MYLQHLQLLQALLNQLLYPPLVRLILVLPEAIPRSPFRVLTEVVGGELVSRSQ